MNETYLPLARREFQRLQPLAERAAAQLSDEQFFAAPAPTDNSVGGIMKHVGGNLLSRWTDFLTSDGEKPNRDRDTEFVITPADTRAALMQSWTEGWAALFAALAPLNDDDLTRMVMIRREPLTVLQAINRQLTHYAYHVGQIVYVSKHHRGPDWHSLSIPRGQSAEFNRAPTPYVPGR